MDDAAKIQSTIEIGEAIDLLDEVNTRILLRQTLMVIKDTVRHIHDTVSMEISRRVAHNRIDVSLHYET